MKKEEYDFYAESEVLERQKDTMKFIEQMEWMRKRNRKNSVLLVLFILLTITGFVMLVLDVLDIVPDFSSGRQLGLWIILSFTLILFPISGAIMVGRHTFFYDYNRSYKYELVKHVLDEMFEHVYYSPSEGFSIREATDMKVINKIDTFHSEDFVEGDYKGCHFAMSECLTCMNTTLDTKLNITAFVGKIFDFDYDKRITSDVYIYGNNFIHPNKEQLNNNKVRLESIDFGRHFQVHCSDAETAFYVLTPQWQEALLELGEMFHYDFAVRISGQRIFAAVTDCRNTLEPPSRKKIDYITECRKIRQDMSVLTCMLEALPIGETKDRFIRHPVPEEKDIAIIHEDSGLDAFIDARTRAVIEFLVIWLVFVLYILYNTWNK